MDRTLGDAKRELRAAMRAVRRSVDDRPARAVRLWRAVEAMPDVVAAPVVMAFEAVPGEPDSRQFIEWCLANGKRVVVPDPSAAAAPPVDPRRIDVVVVPGLAFTPDGRRLGQGGGWYDRVLATLRPDALVIGVCFAPQLVSDLPTEPHDVKVDVVATDEGIAS